MLPKLLAAAALVLACAACSSDGDDTTTTAADAGGDAEAAVSIDDFAFAPADVTVAAGTTVTWTNDDAGLPHTTTAGDATWNSGTLQPGDTFAFTFDTAGTFEYMCTIHPSMSGTVTVEG